MKRVSSLILPALLWGGLSFSGKSAVSDQQDTLVTEAANIIRAYEQAIFKRDIASVRGLLASNGVYFAKSRRIVNVSDNAGLLQAIALEAPRGNWDEKSVPLVHVNFVHQLGNDARLVSACITQPTLMTAPVESEFILLKQNGAWKIASVNSLSSCGS